MAYGKKVELQEGRGSSVGQGAMRWAFTSEDVGKRFEPIRFWVDKDCLLSVKIWKIGWIMGNWKFFSLTMNLV